jgi:hypothetical protein
MSEEKEFEPITLEERISQIETLLEENKILKRVGQDIADADILSDFLTASASFRYRCVCGRLHSATLESSPGTRLKATHKIRSECGATNIIRLVKR